MNNIDRQYKELLEHILHFGVEKKDRTGTGTKSLFGWQIRHNMKDGFPLLTTKKMAWKQVVTELLWFLKGRTDLRYLLENKCHIWTGDAYKVYDKEFDLEHPPFSAPYPPRLTIKEFEEKIMTDDNFNNRFGNLGPIYGTQWRNWEYGDDKAFKNGKTYPSGEFMYDIRKESIDQISTLINDLKTNPDSRRLMVNAWNVGELSQMTLPPCHYGFQVYTRELSGKERMKLYQTGEYTNGSVKLGGTQWDHKWMDTWAPSVPKRAISLMWNQRSVDTFLGLPFNIASYGLLLCIIAEMVDMVPEELIGNLGDTHLYLNHLEQAKEQIARTPYELPKLRINTEFWLTESGECGVGPLSNNVDALIEGMEINDFQIENYQSHPTIKAPLSN